MKNKSIKNLIKIPLYIFALLVIHSCLTLTAQAATPSLTIDSIPSAKMGDHIIVPIVGRDFVGSNITALQFRINYDPTLLNYTGFDAAVPAVSGLSISTTTGSLSILRVSLDNALLTLDNQNLVLLRFDVLTNISTTTSMVYATITDVSPLSSSPSGAPANTVFNPGTIRLNAPVISNAPSMPNMLSAMAGNGNALVLFTPPTDNGGSQITGYTVTSSPDNVTAVRNISPVTVTGLTNGKLYTFTVTATNASGKTSSSSYESNAVRPTSARSVPGVPINLTATAGNGGVILNWNPPTINEQLPFGVTQTSNIFRSVLAYFSGPRRITDYIVEYRIAGSGNWITYNDGVNTSTSVSIGGLSNGTTYDFAVSAASGGDLGSASNIVRVMPVDPNADRPIVSISADPLYTLLGTPASISWSSTNATACNVMKDNSTTTWRSGLNGVNISTGPISNSVTFRIVCTGQTGLTNTASVTVQIRSSSGGVIRTLIPDTEPEEVPVVVPVQQEVPMPAPLLEVSSKTGTTSLSATIFNVIKRFFGF